MTARAQIAYSRAMRGMNGVNEDRARRGIRAAAILVALVCAGLAASGCGGAPATGSGSGSAGTDSATRADADAEQRLAALVERYIAETAAAAPTVATYWGIHEHDHRVADLSAEGMAARAAQLRALLAEVESIERASLRPPAYYDHRLLEYRLRAGLLELEEIRTWERNPMNYVSEISSALASLVDRDFAPMAERMPALEARMAAIPSVVAAARANLGDDLSEVPAVWAATALRMAEGLVDFVRDDLPARIADEDGDAISAEARASFARTHAQALRDLEGFVGWLRDQVAPAAQGDFRLGRELFMRKLRYEEHVEITPEELRAQNQKAIRFYHEWVARETARIDPSAEPAAVMAAITERYPAPEELLDTARGYLQQAREFVIERDLLTLPSRSQPTVRPTPPYARLGFASMSVPGPFEEVATEAYYNITTVNPAWSPTQVHQHMTYFNHPGLLGVTVHEGFPGHYVQLLFRDALPSVMRLIEDAGTLREGWAHYVEQMMIDEGLGEGAPEIRLGQLRRALQRHARWHAALALHVFDASVEETSKRFEEIAYFAAFPARRETERGTYNPTYLYYALGRMQILELRDALAAAHEARGEAFSLRAFHDQFLGLGLPPSLAREVMLGETPSAR
ncbi:protein of unknown function DUF885 [Haliangium ochraceum DSM 14365]|uniref:DUF885 domain-containing protein n=2 Tax=Haliangium ochraceum TaxID=80816 RepID=D0LFS0_HALO1|nr:protein of unknown function DUF885 [Haliangium ochraceum DSM 14365]